MNIRYLILIISFISLTSIVNAKKYKTNYNYDYSQTIVMKIDLSVPDGKGGTRVINTFEDALKIIKAADYLSLQTNKIVYLVGPTYNGHDDKYPALFELNEALKRPQDSSAYQSFEWLFKEAKKYNTIVSLHINMTDAYENSPMWQEYVEKDLLSKNRLGKLKVTGNYNHRKAYEVSYKKEWEAGYTQKRIDSLLKVFPILKEAGTIHIDAWIARPDRGHHISKKEQIKYQKKALEYWRKKGIDVTSEWVMPYMTGLVPFAWHFNGFSQEDYLKVPANDYTGSGLNKDLKRTDFALGFLFGKSIYGENAFPSLQKAPNDTSWYKKFMRDFFLNSLQYFYLNKLERLKVKGNGKNRVAYFSDNVVVSLADSTIYKGKDLLLRDKNFVFFPLVWKKDKEIGTFSLYDATRTIKLPENWKNEKYVSMYLVTSKGLKFLKKIPVKNGKITLKLKGDTGYVLKPS